MPEPEQEIPASWHPLKKAETLTTSPVDMRAEQAIPLQQRRPLPGQAILEDGTLVYDPKGYISPQLLEGG